MKKYLFIFALLFPLCATAATERLCGTVRPFNQNGKLLYGIQVMVSSLNAFNGAVAYAPNVSPELEWMNSMGGHHICITYTYPMESSTGLVTFSQGTIDRSSLKCLYTSQYNTTSCTRCSTGYVAKIPSNATGTTDYLTDLHTNTSCAYCNRGYYHNGSSCVKCPDSGYTENYDSSSIANCYIYSESSDETGTYASQKCYYQ